MGAAHLLQFWWSQQLASRENDTAYIYRMTLAPGIGQRLEAAF